MGQTLLQLLQIRDKMAFKLLLCLKLGIDSWINIQDNVSKAMPYPPNDKLIDYKH